MPLPPQQCLDVAPSSGISVALTGRCSIYPVPDMATRFLGSNVEM